MKKLTIGDAAPDFSLTDTFGARVNLRDYKSSFVLVPFLRYAGCPWCNLAIHRLVMEFPLLESSNIKTIAFIQSSGENIKNNIFERHARKPLFPVIPDKSLETYHQYGVHPSLASLPTMLRTIPAWVQSVNDYGFTNKNVDGNLFLAPAVFLISPNDQTIILAEYTADLYEHESFSHIYDAASSYAFR